MASSIGLVLRMRTAVAGVSWYVAVLVLLGIAIAVCQAGAAMAQTGVVQSPADEWRGVYTCGGADFYSRLVMTRPLDNTGSVTGTIEFGPSPDSISNRGEFGVAGHFSKPDGALQVEPQQWIHQAYPGDPMFGIDGTLVSGNFLTGKVVGLPKCTEFRLWHYEPEQLSNPNGLLLRSEDIDIDDCRTYAKWLTTGRELHFGSYYVSSLVFDTNGQLRVLGHTADQWTAADALKYPRFADMCQMFLSSSATIDDAKLLHQAGLFRVAPFDQNPTNWLLGNWDRVDAIIVLRADAEKQSAERLSRLAALPRAPVSLQEFDNEINTANNPAGDLRYLEDREKAIYVAKLVAERQAFETAVGLQASSQVNLQTQNAQSLRPGPAGTLESALAIAGPFMENTKLPPGSSSPLPPDNPYLTALGKGVVVGLQMRADNERFFLAMNSAREAMFEAYSGAPGLDVLRANYQKMLKEKDYWYLGEYLLHGFQPANEQTVQQDDVALGRGGYGGGIDPDEFDDFTTWLDAVRTAGGAPDQGTWFPDLAELQQALDETTDAFQTLIDSQERIEYANYLREHDLNTVRLKYTPKMTLNPISKTVTELDNSNGNDNLTFKRISLALVASNAKIMTCVYRPTTLGDGIRADFWYQKMPPEILLYRSLFKSEALAVEVPTSAYAECPPPPVALAVEKHADDVQIQWNQEHQQQ